MACKLIAFIDKQCAMSIRGDILKINISPLFCRNTSVEKIST